MKKTGPLLLLGGGVLGAIAIWFGAKKSKDTEIAIDRAISGLDGPGGGKVQLRLTGYWPFQSGLNAAGRKMEGGIHDRKGAPLHTVEDYLAKRADFVSLSGDDAIWPYGQRVDVPWGGVTLLGRVVDTGSHFRGPTKVQRAMGFEPIDVCVASSKTVIPQRQVMATIVPRDNFAKGKAVATGKFAGQKVAGDIPEPSYEGELASLYESTRNPAYARWSRS